MLKLTSLEIDQVQIAYGTPILNLEEAICSKLHTSMLDYANSGQPKCPQNNYHKAEKLNTFNLEGSIHRNINNKNYSGLSRLSYYQISCLGQNEGYIHIDGLAAVKIAGRKQKEINLDIFCGVACCLNYTSASLQIRRHKNLIREVAPSRRIIEPLVRAA